MLVKDKKFTETPIKLPSKEGIRVISEMTTGRILWYVTCRHSSGLKTTAIVVLAGVLIYDKVVRVFI